MQIDLFQDSIAIQSKTTFIPPIEIFLSCMCQAALAKGWGVSKEIFILRFWFNLFKYSAFLPPKLSARSFAMQIFSRALSRQEILQYG